MSVIWGEDCLKQMANVLVTTFFFAYRVTVKVDIFSVGMKDGGMEYMIR